MLRTENPESFQHLETGREELESLKGAVRGRVYQEVLCFKREGRQLSKMLPRSQAKGGTERKMDVGLDSMAPS